MKGFECQPFLSGETAVLAGAPTGFDLAKSLTAASRVRLATAFAHQSGWKLLKDHLLKGKTELALLAGLDFCQTEPVVLKDWLKLSQSGSNARAYLAASSGPMFHPKVLIVENGKSCFALVGSGNLSAGGLNENVECWVYSGEGSVVKALVRWYDGLLADPKKTLPLTAAAIATYLPKFKNAQKSRRYVRRLQSDAERAIVEGHASTMARWRQAVKEAARYFASKQFDNDWKGHAGAISGIKAALRYPTFDFNLTGWREFYDYWAFGHLIPISRDRIYQSHGGLLKAGFRQLVDERVDIETRLTKLLEPDGQYRIDGVNLNVVTKVLMVHDPAQWPVYNGAVKEALDYFDYEAPYGASPARKYLAFAQLMRRFRVESGAKKLPHLDAFFFHKFDSNRD